MNFFYGDGLERIYMVMGDAWLTKWLEYSVDFDLHNKTLWTKLIGFLEKEIKIQQQKTFIGKERCQNPTRYKPSTHISNRNEIFVGLLMGYQTYSILFIPYICRKKHLRWMKKQRFSLIRKRGFCFQCLFPGAKTFFVVCDTFFHVRWQSSLCATQLFRSFDHLLRFRL